MENAVPTRPWKRFVSLMLVNRAFEEVLEGDLCARFPPEQFAFNIEIIGESSGAGATVKVTGHPDGQLSEVAVVYFPRGRPSKSVLLAAVTELVSKVSVDTGACHLKA